MMKRNLFISACTIIISVVLGISGVTLAQPTAENQAEDRMAGVFITREYLDLFDFEAYLTDNFKAIEDGTIIADGDDSKYQGRLYATLNDEGRYVFEDINGIPYFHYRVTDENGSYTTTTGNDRIADGHVSIKHTDDGQEVNLEGTIYTPPTKDITHFYINPVYQSESGEIYVVSGSGISFDSDGSEGGAFTQTIDAITTVTENGETESFSTSVKISIAVKSAPESHSILEFGADGVMISNDAYNPGDLPDTITPHHNCAYIILESTSGKNVARTLYQKEDSFIETFYPGDDSILRIQQTSLEWID
jgi:hypothetical protein